ncbi:MAG TPA: hypothetical protein VG406_21645 [Isosphaeraceae bacterium]|jgi:hypothetical protein|nr:hypothetical protein [Isosphaeraceae bacterium]
MIAPNGQRRRRALVAAAAVFLLLGSARLLLDLRARRVRPTDPVAPDHGEKGLEAFVVRNAHKLGKAGEPLMKLTSCSSCHSD